MIDESVFSKGAAGNCSFILQFECWCRRLCVSSCLDISVVHSFLWLLRGTGAQLLSSQPPSQSIHSSVVELLNWTLTILLLLLFSLPIEIGSILIYPYQRTKCRSPGECLSITKGFWAKVTNKITITPYFYFVVIFFPCTESFFCHTQLDFSRTVVIFASFIFCV